MLNLLKIILFQEKIISKHKSFFNIIIFLSALTRKRHHYYYLIVSKKNFFNSHFFTNNRRMLSDNQVQQMPVKTQLRMRCLSLSIQILDTHYSGLPFVTSNHTRFVPLFLEYVFVVLEFVVVGRSSRLSGS